MFQTQGDLEKAVQFYNKSLEINKALGRKEGMTSNYDSLRQKGVALSELSQAEKAIKLFSSEKYDSLHYVVDRSNLNREKEVLLQEKFCEEGDMEIVVRQILEQQLQQQILEQQLQQLKKSFSLLKYIFNEIEEKNAKTNMDIFTFMWAATIGAEHSELEITRYIPTTIYVGEPVPDSSALEELVKAVVALGETVDFELAEELPAEDGSWFKKIFLKTKKPATSKKLNEYLEKIEVGLDLYLLNEKQAEINCKQAEATARLMSALKTFDGPCCIKSGSVLAVQLVGPEGKKSFSSTTLNPIQLKRLEENHQMLNKPNEILNWLGSLAKETDEHEWKLLSGRRTAELPE